MHATLVFAYWVYVAVYLGRRYWKLIEDHSVQKAGVTTLLSGEK